MNNSQNNKRQRSGENRSARSQSPSSRRVSSVGKTCQNINPNQSSRRQLSERELAILREKRRAENIRKKQRTKIFFGKLRAVLFFAVIGALISLTAIFSVCFFDYKKTDKAPVEKVTVVLSDGTKNELSNSYYFYRNGEYYVSLTKIASLCGLTLHGDVNNMTMAFDGDICATFDIGTKNVNIANMNCIMTNPSLFENGQLFVPASFFTKYCSGIKTAHTKKGSSKVFTLTFAKDFSLLAKTSPTTSLSNGISEKKSDSDNSAVTPTFKADLSAYEEYMNPENRDEYLTLINTTHMLSSDYIPDDLTDIADTRRDGRGTQQMRLYAAKALEAMFIEMRACGINDVSVTSGYRSYSYQTSLLNNEIALLTPTYGSDAERVAKTQVAIPGSSEHQSGLCIDMHNLPSASEAFASEDAYKWLYANCADFGFILRFPKDKSDKTGIIFEPWHYRYVGRYHAQKIMESGMCLEEYVESLS